ncbi:4Fe-4S dicluster domain-containing protein [Clostridium sp.]|uniref:4Fe-4S dicluster domain-containing protein n=1 Tax=Clostridium sp. TaxID=1506 RepID=UPI0032167AD6
MTNYTKDITKAFDEKLDETLIELRRKVQGFLYENCESIFKRSTLPTPAESYKESDLSILVDIVDKYSEIYKDSLGIINGTKVDLNQRECIACTRCTKYCPSGALEKINKELVLHEDKCLRCGNCIGNCSFLALSSEKTGLTIYINSTKESCPPHILPKFYAIEEIPTVMDKLLAFYNTHKSEGDTFATTVNKVGFNELLNYIEG